MPRVAVPCVNCGSELYDRVRKYHMDVPCDADPCYNFKDGHWSEGSYCPECNTNQREGLDPEVLAAERVILFPGEGDA